MNLTLGRGQAKNGGQNIERRLHFLPSIFCLMNFRERNKLGSSKLSVKIPDPVMRPQEQ